MKDVVAATGQVCHAIRLARRSAGLSLTELAKRLDLANSTLSKIETGKISVSFERLEAISQALDISVSQLIGSTPHLSDGPKGAPLRVGTRRSIDRQNHGLVVNSGQYIHTFQAADILRKEMQPIISEIICDSIENYGPLTVHAGEEFNYVIEGNLEFHSDVYAPVELSSGDSIYFDAEMGHAHIRIGDAKCRLLVVISPRGERDRSEGTLEINRIQSGALAGVTQPSR